MRVFIFLILALSLFSISSSTLLHPNILALHGGGARGATIIETIKYLSTVLYNDPTGLSFINEFDIIAGTSAGSCIATVMSEGHPVPYVKEFFANFSTRIFPYKLVNESTVYNTTDYVNVLKDALGDTLGKDISKRIFATSVDITKDPWETYLWTSYRPFASSLNVSGEIVKFMQGSPNLPLWRFDQASTAVPTYFDPVTQNGITVVDGAVKHNNPSILAIREAQRLWPHRKINLVVSIGTGTSNVIANTTGMPPEIAALFLLPQLSQQTHYECAGLIEEEMPWTMYHQFNVPGGADDVLIDETNLGKIKELELKTRNYLKTKSRRVAIRQMRRRLTMA